MSGRFGKAGEAASALCGLAVLAAGVACAAAVRGWVPAQDALYNLFGLDREGWGLVAVGTALTVVCFALSLVALLRPVLGGLDRDLVSLENERGDVRISTATIADYLQRRASEVEGIESVRLQVASKEQGLSLDLYAVVIAGDPLPVVTRRLQNFVERELRETLGIREFEGVHIHFSRISGPVRPALPHFGSPPSNKSEALDAEVRGSEPPSK